MVANAHCGAYNIFRYYTLYPLFFKSFIEKICKIWYDGDMVIVNFLKMGFLYGWTEEMGE